MNNNHELFRMLITEENNGVYASSIKLMNNELENQNPIDTIEMGLTLTKIDILVEEIQTVREEPINQNDLYKLIEEGDKGNPMQNGAMWRARVMKLTKDVFYEIMHSSKIPETYKQHSRMLQNVIKENKWTESMEFVAVGWVETNEKYAWVCNKMTKRMGGNFEARMEIFKTKTKVLNECKKKTKLSKNITKFIGKTRGWN